MKKSAVSESVRALLPEMVKIGPFDFRIHPWPPAEAMHREALGEIDKTNLQIRIRNDLHPQRLAEVLLHEIMHGIWMVSNLESEKSSEELVVTMFSTVWLQVMRDNPDVMQWIKAILG